MTVCRPELAWIDGSFARGIEIRCQGGVIESVHSSDEPLTHPDTALLPGMVNAHSHAFQRGLRGHAEVFTHPEDDFWTWRTAMYDLVDRLDADATHHHSLQAFNEMRRAGITAVGEFHYVHHGPGGHDWTLDEAVLSAARDAGIRIVLLHACYLAGGFDKPLAGGQCRFDGVDFSTWCHALDRAQRACTGDLQSVGVVIHSLRAVPIDIAVQVRQEAARRGMVIHLHLEEQPAEIETCRAAHGCTPMQLVLDRLDPGPDMTAVHCTHTTSEDMAAYAQEGGRVCLCPLTEANLGDGVSDLPGIQASGAPICLGTDSNARISMLEEMRLCAYGQRLWAGRRGVCTDQDGRIDRPLISMATCGGAGALGLEAGEIRSGACADFTMIDLASPMLAGWTEHTLATSLITGCGDAVISGTVVNGAF